jgi:(p)ppGpp synthase/HD superfamily hydrolase
MEYDKEIEDYLEPVTKALEFARKAHAGQTYTVEGDYFDAHIKRVWYQLLIQGATNIEQVVGILHDVYEDTAVSRLEITELFGYTVDDLVWQLSRKEEETYFDYIRRVKENETCRKVKIADAGCNHKASVISGNISLMGRYTYALLILQGVIP